MNSSADQRPGARCPVCAKFAAPGYEPFCSKRCADVDLHRWLSGAYAIPAPEDDGDAPDAPQDGS